MLWSCPLDPVYAVIFIDAVNVKIREGQVANRPIYLALGVTVDGERECWACGPASTATARAPSTGCGC
jgi:transposase-like protein